MLPLTNPKFQAFDENGNFLVGGKLYTYGADTSLAATTYSDHNLTVANTNPVILDARGECDVYGTSAYKLVLKDSADSTIWTVPRVSFFSSGDYARPEEFGAVGDGTTDDYAALMAAIATKKHILLNKKNYAISDSLWLYSGQNLIGYGYDSKITMTHATGGYAGGILNIAGAGRGDGPEYDISGSTYCYGNIVDGVHFVGAGVANEAGIGVGDAIGCIVKNCFFTNIGWKAITLQIRTYFNHVHDCHIFSAGVESVYKRAAITIEGETAVSDDCYGNIVENITVTDGGTSAVVNLTYCRNNIVRNITTHDNLRVIVLATTACHNVIENIVATNTLANKLIDIQADTCTDNIFRNFKMQETTLAGAAIECKGPRNHFINITVKNTSGTVLAISDTDADDCVIDKCHLTGDATNSTYGISCTGDRLVVKDTQIETTAMMMYCTGDNNRINGVKTASLKDISGTSGMYFPSGSTGNIIQNCHLLGGGAGSVGINCTAASNIITGNIVDTGTVSIAASQTNVSGNSWQPRTGSTSPAGSVTPYNIGEIYIDTTNHKVYCDETVAASGWLALN